MRRLVLGTVTILLGAGLTAACGARSTLSLSEGGGGPGGSPATSSASAGASSNASSSSVSTGAATSSSSGQVCEPEVCDGLDNDCDGVVDNGNPGGFHPCDTGIPGACADGFTTCQDAHIVCTPKSPPSPEVCDGQDNDCNGKVDDGNPGGGLPCDTGMLGVCAAGVTQCQGAHIVCAPKTMPSPEVCDGLDNDCNGKVDEVCATGCSDGTREGFVDQGTYPEIAGCSGGWTIPGVFGTLTPACGRISGNSSANPSGMGCDVADLCALGFHVCTGPDEVKARSPTGCGGAANAPGLFFVTRQSSNGCNVCALGNNTDPSVCDGMSCQAGCAQTSLTTNDLYGCGSIGVAVTSCGVLDRASNNLCGALGPPWSCSDQFHEASVVTKPASAGGGVLCCSD